MPTCKIRNTCFEHEMSAQMAAKMVQKVERAIKATGLKAEGLKSATTAEEREEVTMWLLTHPKAKLAAVFRSARLAKTLGRPSLEVCLEVAEGLNLTQPIQEPVRVYPKPKADKKGFRPVADFGLQHRAAQQMIKVVLEIAFKPRPFQYACAGRGLPEAAQRIRKLVAEGRRYFAHLDIQSYFTNFDAEQLSMALPIPKWAVENVVAGRHMKWKASGGCPPYSSPSTLIQEARRGIPQGSSISPLIAMIECSKLGLTATSLVNYIDDFLHLASSPEERQAGIAELTSAIEALPGGQFTPKTKSQGHLADGCIFLGHEFRLAGDKLLVSPSEANYERLIGKLEEIEIRHQLFASLPVDKCKAIAVANDCMKYIDNWKVAFRECDQLEERYLGILRKTVIEVLELGGGTLEDLDPSASTEPFDEAEHAYL
jgi:Reverse transcriptase (RNA-dependent DNA polymerase)